LGRTQTQFRCEVEGCDKPAHSRHKCVGHLKAWQRANQHLRCSWERCGAYQDDGPGRRMGSGRGKRWYCRAHEVEHLRPSPDIEEMNIARLGASLRAEGECWIWTGRLDPKSNRPKFDPEGSDRAEWVAYRVVWNLLTGGHRHGLELDHCRCHDIRCCSPAHLEPVTRSENERRKKKPARRINTTAATTPAVVAFAERFALPLPL
jgi:hypothetical protein